MTADELVAVMMNRFKGVPGFTKQDALDVITEAMANHGYKPSDSVNPKDVNLVLLSAQAQGAWQIAVSVAHYFKFTDGEESVDKSMVAENYRKLARDFQEEYDRAQAKLFGNNFKIAPRIDRPNTTPRTGNSGGAWRTWRRY